jgi:hypothetical protein
VNRFSEAKMNVGNDEIMIKIVPYIKGSGTKAENKYEITFPAPITNFII